MKRVVNLHKDFTVDDWEFDKQERFENATFERIASLSCWKAGTTVSSLHQCRKPVKLPEPTNPDSHLRSSWRVDLVRRPA